MLSFKIACLLTIALIYICFIAPKVDATKDDEYAKREAEFALEELRKLSNSGVYESIDLEKILSVSFEDGSFHETTSLQLLLSSPYYKSGAPTEAFEVIVLTHKEDGVKSLAIDNFPVMTDDSMEQHLVIKAERKKKEREESFRYLELEMLRSGKVGEPPQGQSIEDLFEELDTPDALKERELLSLDVQLRLTEPYATEEKELSHLSLAALYKISLGNSEQSDFKVERARAILDRALLATKM